jgi:NtrC-family two-component system sensor histidine kinase KinB
MAQRNNQRVLTMLDQLLDVARIDTVEPETTCDSIDLAQLLSEVVADIRTSATQAGIDLALDPILPLPPLLAGATALRRVLDNLLNNAISYTPRGGRVTVSAALHPDAGPRGAVAVSVTDTGPGVPPEHRERIFERFVRLSDTRPGHRGFGLGLYYCRQAVQAHGGRIWVEPGPGNRGSRFTFLIPIEGTPHA